MPPRSEPLLWVQLIGVGALPLEGLLLLLLLAGSDPGPVPGLERLLCWALGGLAPTLLLWHRPADVWSLLLLQVPLRARRPLQQRLSSLQDSRWLRLGLVLAGVASLPGLWWLDDHAAVGSAFSPLAGSPRLVVLLLAAIVLALMLWQWQQLLQALWLLSRSPDLVAATRPMPQTELESRRLCLGVPLLLLDPLVMEAGPAAMDSRATAQPAVAPGATNPPSARSPRAAAVDQDDPLLAKDQEQATTDPCDPSQLQETGTQEPPVSPPSAGSSPAELAPPADVPGPEALEPPAHSRSSGPEGDEQDSDASGAGLLPVPVEPEQTAAKQQSGDLDQQIS